VPGVTINRFCASGIDAVAVAAARIRGGDIELAAAGGVESVSRVPMFSDGGPLFCDPATVSKVGLVFMGISADLVATIEGYERDELERRGGRYGVAAVSGAAELGVAVLVERVAS
jgi:acetyl-CoA C-acetyltransferase